jgi:tetratricopeptide (TPR) repeat protein
MMATILFIFILAGIRAFSQAPAGEIEIDATLARAQNAYYEARFDEAIALLAPLNTALDSDADQVERIQDKIRVKLQLALALIGMNQLAEAKARFSEVYDLNPQFSLDRARFAPKVVLLFEEAKAAREEAKCHTMCERVDRPTASNPDAVVNVLEGGPACSCSLPRHLQAAEVVYADATEAYKRGALPEALFKMRTVLMLNPDDHKAAHYVDLIEQKLKMSLDQMLSNWQAQFNEADYAAASESYRQLVSSDFAAKAEPVEDIRAEYRKTLTKLAQSWNEACTVQDRVSMDQFRDQANELVPDTWIGRDILDQMNNCPEKIPPPVETAAVKPPPAPEAPQTCLQVPSKIALLRLKTRVDPEIPLEQRLNGSSKVRAAVRIDEEGNTSVHGLQGGSPVTNRAVVTAVKNWKFYPALVDNHARCVETELPIELKH